MTDDVPAGSLSGDANRADLKSRLARQNVSLPAGSVVSNVERPTGGLHHVVLLDRVGDGTRPAYCVHGYATCIRCDEMCWLGHETVRAVSGGSAYALCLECGREILGDLDPSGRLIDHRRADGPHEES